MMKPINRILALLLSFSLLLLCSCSNKAVKKVNENGEIDDESLPEADITAVDASQIPTYDINSLSQSNTYISKEEVDSYYMQELNTRCLADYNDIKNGLNSFRKEILLTKLITEEELFRIVAIIYVDEPLMFQMASKYSYEMDEDGYISKFYPSYTMSAEEYSRKYRDYMDTMKTLYNSAYLYEEPKSTSGFDATEYNTEMEIIENYINCNLALESESSDSNIASDYCTMYSESRKFAALARYVGLECVVKIGLPTTEHQSQLMKSSDFSVFNLSDIHNYTHKSDNRYTVDFDFDQYCFWNSIKIEGNWYNVDLALNSLISDEYKNCLTDDEYSDINEELYSLGAAINVNDYTMSMSKIMYINDQILGLSPACTEKEFSTTYRNGTYVLKMISSQLVQYMTKEIANYENYNNEYFFYQFEDESNFKEFLDGFDSQISSYNDINANTIVSYNLDYDYSTLTVILHNVEFKN